MKNNILLNKRNSPLNIKYINYADKSFLQKTIFENGMAETVSKDLSANN